ncbi:MAG: ABC transporter substrate-binding protein, partial [Paucibacter sp.]|nr:ABC transporter substrate-binding protein [Roseateles sp.]
MPLGKGRVARANIKPSLTAANRHALRSQALRRNFMPISLPVPLRAVALGLLVACGVAETLAAPIKVAGTLRFCAQGSPKSFDPANSDSGIDHAATYPIFDGLIDNEPGTDRLIPGLAERWTVAADGRSIRFKLRHGVKFHSTAYFKPT